jgi:hypothetical protein
MSGRSSIDALRRLAPVSDGEAAAVFGAAGREALLEDVGRLPFVGETRSRPVTRRRRPFVLALAVVAAAATAAAAWAVLHGSSAHETTNVQCLIGSSDAIIPSTSGDPTHDCAVDYRREFGIAPPQLVGYDNGHGGVTVLPRSKTPPEGYKRLVGGQDVDLIQLQDSLDDYINGLNSSCLDGQAATALVKARLAQFGFTGWTVAVRTAGGTTANPPANAAPTIKNTPGETTCVNTETVDPASQTVTLLPTGIPAGLPETKFVELAARLRPLTRSCRSLPAAVVALRAVASGLGLSASARGYDLNTVTDNSLRCASIYETVGGTIFLTVRGPKH